jgi:hypothetical protein
MLNLNLLAATRTIEKTMPFMLYRLLLCLGIGLAFLLAALAGAGTVIGFSSFSRNPAAFAGIGAAAGFAACGFALYRLRAAWLYAVKASHLALLAAHAKGGPIPEGKAQIAYAKQQVAERFPQSAELFELDQSIRQTLAALPSLRLPRVFQHPQLNQAANWLIGRFFAANHQTILAWHFFSGADNAWLTAKAALTGLAGYFPPALKSRAILSAFELLGFIAAYLLLLVPAQGVAGALPVSVGAWQYVFAAVFAWTLKMAFFEPIAEAAMMENLFPHLQADSRWEEDLSRESAAFRKIQGRSER